MPLKEEAKKEASSTTSKNALVGLSVADQLSATKKDLDDQLTLLKAVNSGQEITSYNLVTHNNNVDARVGSTNTLPTQYGQQNIEAAKSTEQTLPEVTSTVSDVSVNSNINNANGAVESKLNQRVKKIVWKNDSLNTLSKNLAKSIGYSFVTKASPSGIADANVNFSVEGVTVKEAIKELSNKTSNVADILVFEENKTVNVLYK